MDQINDSNKCCATCLYWLGNRTPDRLGFVQVSSRMEQGQCGARELSEHYFRQAVYCCGEYQRWISGR